MSPTAFGSQSVNHRSCSAPARHACGASRTQAVVVMPAVVNFGSVKVRDRPVSMTVREPSVKDASCAPAASRTIVRDGCSCRS